MYSRGRLLEFNKASLSSHHQKRFLSPLKQVQQLSWLSSHHAGRESFGLQLRLLLEIHIALREWDCSPFFSRASILGKCHLVNQFESDLNQEYWTFFWSLHCLLERLKVDWKQLSWNFWFGGVYTIPLTATEECYVRVFNIKTSFWIKYSFMQQYISEYTIGVGYYNRIGADLSLKHVVLSWLTETYVRNYFFDIHQQTAVIPLRLRMTSSRTSFNLLKVISSMKIWNHLLGLSLWRSIGSF